jgi:hypothetical protein
MIYIFSGVDRTGKTTMADLLSIRSNMPKFKSSSEIFSKIDLEEAIKHDWRFFIDVYKSIPDVDIIFDRSFVCQWVYSTHLRASNIYQRFHDMHEYDTLFETYIRQLTGHVKFIFCTRQDWNGEQDEIIESSDFKPLQQKYRFFYERFGIEPLELKFENGIEYNYNEVKKLI